MSPHLIPLLVYTVGVKCRGINKKEVYGPEEMFSLSEKRAQTMLKVCVPFVESLKCVLIGQHRLRLVQHWMSSNIPAII